MAVVNSSLRTTTYTGNTVLPANRAREYLLIVPEEEDEIIRVGCGKGTDTLPFCVFEPLYAPSTEVRIICAGTYHVTSNV